MLQRQEAAILLIMEDAVKRAQLTKHLEQLGHTVTAAKDGVEAMQTLQTYPSFDIILISLKASLRRRPASNISARQWTIKSIADSRPGNVG